MTASSIRILTAATALAAGCHRCSAFTSNGLGGINSQRRARLPPPSSSSAVAAAALAALRTRTYATSTNMNAASTTIGNLHGQGSCFLPLLQNDEDYIAPRIVQIAGAYPGVDVETYLALSSEPSAELGQWSYDFSDPDGPQMGTVALPGMTSVYETEDPVVIIADHISLGVTLPPAVTEPVDLVVLCDRARTTFAERRFLVLELEDAPGEVTIAAFESKGEMPANAKIHGQVTLVQIPWLPNMTKKKSGFMEDDELF